MAFIMWNWKNWKWAKKLKVTSWMYMFLWGGLSICCWVWPISCCQECNLFRLDSDCSISCFKDTFVKWHKESVSQGMWYYVELIIFPFILFKRRGPQLPWWSGNIFLWKRLSLEMGRKKRNWNLFTNQLFQWVDWLPKAQTPIICMPQLCC